MADTSADTPRDVDPKSDLTDDVALVTGATRGIGAEIAAELADLGATVYAGARDPDDVTATDQHAVRLDVTDDEEVRAAVDRIEREQGSLDVLVNNAGVFARSGPLHEMDTADFDRTMAVNLRGPVVLTKHALPLLLDGPGGRVVTLSSGLGRFTDGQMDGDYPAYRLSKVGVGGLTAYLHGEYGDRGLIANAVSPGWVRTDMGGDGAPRPPSKGAETPVWLARFAPGSPAGHLWKDRERVSW
ncbi:3-oxoacyl-[acyl-carrier protein] reductase [Halorubrum distributum JCM 9100]|uniref:3-oxoacyl-[acyl-carrier protein] reductase n=2 Tax=Halorubrum distributum TaxID=29283 RepID=M0EZV2_9EURY|nr:MULTISPECIES: SDR family NAD(P)-dependent oxidoreductase [Halorubrum distributum group]ELZ35230.1 3-oxoacyl-[acyl-carrier protein] reductase [Halorubrum terrestre JCM 10247]ELZ51924.1 3-oxoacyl-[acyl-carrier protein] reductase [Halorubrum distributum JCM 9100]